MNYSQLELSESRPPFVIIRMSDFNLACTYICTSAHYKLYIMIIRYL